MSAPAMMRIGVRLPAENPAAGWKAAVYDLDTGALLPAEQVRLIIEPDALITAQITVVVEHLEMVP